MNNLTIQRTIYCLLLVLFFAGKSIGGITADAGLTPALDRWIIRTQIRFMQRDGNPTTMPNDMKSYMVPLVIAYGLRPELTLMIRQVYVDKEMTMMSGKSKVSGFGDLLVLAKYRAFRSNNINGTFGVAPLLGIEFPTGQKTLTGNGYNLKTGTFVTWRNGNWKLDLNMTYTFNGFAGGDDKKQNGVFEIITAVSRQFGYGEYSNKMLAPVVEFTYKNSTKVEKNGIEEANSGESIFQISPGLKFTHNSTILEFLINVPVWQEQNGNQPEWKLTGLFGIRYMF